MQFPISLSLMLLLSMTVNAQDISTSKEIDTNQDGKPDRIESFRNGYLISVARDTKYVGKYDETSYYFSYESPAKPTEIIEKDTDDDGKVDRIEKVYRNPRTDIMITTVKISRRRGPASIERTWSTYSRLSELKVEDGLVCKAELPNRNVGIANLMDSINSVRFSLDDGFYKTSWGYNIHQSCMDRWGADKFPEALKTSMQAGMKCLEDLAKTFKTPNGAYRNAKDFEHLFSSKPIALTCNENKEWHGDDVAHASRNLIDEIRDSKIKHPFISIRSALPKEGGKATDVEIADVTKTIFHEQFHNIGISHGKDIEYAYSCETCCLGTKVGKKEKDLACKVCSGNYEGMSDKNYIIDLASLGKFSPEVAKNSEKAVLNFQNEFPEERFGMIAYANAASGALNPVGNELAKILKQKFSNLTNQENYLLADILKQKDARELKILEPYSQVVAEAHYNLYYEQNTTKVLNDYEKEIPKFKKLLEMQEFSKGSTKVLYESVTEKMATHLRQISLQNYPENNSPENKKAQSILAALKIAID